MNARRFFLMFLLYACPLMLNVAARQLPVDVVVINALFPMLVLLTARSWGVVMKNEIPRTFIALLVVYLIIGAVDMLREGAGLLTYLARNYGVVGAIGIVGHHLMFTEGDRRTAVRRLAFFFAAVFMMQLIFSIYESLHFEDFIVNSYDWNTANKSLDYYPALELQDRLQIDFFFRQLNLPFNMTFSGMLGQHNHWGTQLPFYCLFFGYAYFITDRRHPVLLLLIGATMFASLMNTSRFGMISIILNSVVFFFVLSSIPRWLKWSVALSVAGVLVYYLDTIIENIIIYIALTDTFSSRVDTWEVLGRMMFERSFLSTLIGSPFTELRMIAQRLEWEDYENLAFTLIFERGLPYAVWFIGFLVTITIRSAKLALVDRTMVRLLVANMVLVSLWSNVLFRFTSLIIVALLLTAAFVPQRTLAPGGEQGGPA